jgi:hypothetical protein
MDEDGMFHSSARVLILLAMVAFAAPMLGCKGKADEPIVEKPAPRLALEGFDSYAQYLPADALALVVIDGRETLGLLEVAMPPERAHNKERRQEHLTALERDINRTLMEHYGVDFTLAERVVLGIAKDRVSIVMLGEVAFKATETSKTAGSMTFKALDSAAAREQMGETFWTMMLPDNKGVVMVVGDEAVDALGAGKTLASQPERAKDFEALFATAPELGLSIAVKIDDEEIKQAAQGAPFPPPDAVFFQASKDINAVFFGSDEALNGIKTTYESALSAAGTELANARTETRDSGDPASTIAASVAFHTFGAWRDSIQVQGPAKTQLAFRIPSPAPDQNMVVLMMGGLVAGGMFFMTGINQSFEDPVMIEAMPEEEEMMPPSPEELEEDVNSESEL